MSGGKEGTYQYTLDEKTLEKAKRELNEDPKETDSHIETLRKWVVEQPHINSRTDDAFLLRFLRSAKFSQLRAQEVLDHFWTMRSVEGKGAPDWFTGLDPTRPELQELLDLGQAVPLPGRDDEGRKVILIRTGAYDPKQYDMSHVMKVGFMNNDVLLMDEENQVHGFVIFLDFSTFSASHVWNWNRENISKAMKCWQDTYPMRQKAVHYYNMPMVFNALFEIFQFFTKEKMKKRIHIHRSSLESVCKQIPKRMLPAEYGGDAGPLDVLTKNWKNEVVNNSDEFLLNMQFGIDESKRPKKESSDSGWGIMGAFRKLNVE